MFKNSNREANVSSIRRLKDVATPQDINLVKLISEIVYMAWVKEGRAWEKYGSNYVPLMPGKSKPIRVCSCGRVQIWSKQFKFSPFYGVPDDDSEAVRSVGVGRAVAKEIEN